MTLGRFAEIGTCYKGFCLRRRSVSNDNLGMLITAFG